MGILQRFIDSKRSKRIQKAERDIAALNKGEKDSLRKNELDTLSTIVKNAKDHPKMTKGHLKDVEARIKKLKDNPKDAGGHERQRNRNNS